MFTGLVRVVGWLEASPGGVRVRLTAGSDSERDGMVAALGGLNLGDSISVDGVCLTVAERFADGFRADVSEETLRRTTLAGRAADGEAVNLEPALRLSDRLGGHLVSGHIDGTGVVTGIRRQQGAWRLSIRWQESRYGRYVCEKASVAVDGISLTVAGCEGEAEFWIAVIPHTWAATTLQRRRPGDPVNLEADLLAKYTERLLQHRAAEAGDGRQQASAPLDAGWLAEHGWS